MDGFWTQAGLLAVGALLSLGGVALQWLLGRGDRKTQVEEQRRDRAYSDRRDCLIDFLALMDLAGDEASRLDERRRLASNGWSLERLDERFPQIVSPLKLMADGRAGVHRLDLFFSRRISILADRAFVEAIALQGAAHDGVGVADQRGDFSEAVETFREAALGELHGKD